MLKSLKVPEAQKIGKEEAFDIIRNMLKEEIALARRKQIDEDKFNLPAWDKMVAMQLGMIKAFDKVIQFLPDQGK